jgi:phosphoglycolate phosphatase-like HAD superfamily hydrolase
VKLVIFDVDGTLVDSQDLIVAAQRQAFAAHGLAPPSRARSLSVVGLSLPEAFTALVGAHGPAESLAAAYKEAFGCLRADPAYHEPLFPGAADLIADLAQQDGVTLGIATGNPGAAWRTWSSATAGPTSSPRSRPPMTRRPNPIRPCCGRRWTRPAPLRATRP